MPLFPVDESTNVHTRGVIVLNLATDAAKYKHCYKDGSQVYLGMSCKQVFTVVQHLNISHALLCLDDRIVKL